MQPKLEGNKLNFTMLKVPSRDQHAIVTTNNPYKDDVTLHRLRLRIQICVWPKVCMKGFTTKKGISTKRLANRINM